MPSSDALPRRLTPLRRLRVFWVLRNGFSLREAWRLSKQTPSVERAYALMDGAYL